MDIKAALSQVTTWFTGYVKGYASDDSNAQENIDLKINHTFRVRSIIVDIGTSMHLKKDEICIAEACALLHDIGRFEQYRRYGTFSDSKSENHAHLGVRIIREHDVLKNFPLEAKKIIIRSVGCHNMSFIPEKGNKKWILFLKLLRDADKIDILYVVTEYYKNSVRGSNRVLELHLPDTDTISEAIYEPLLNGKIALVKDLCSLNDFKLYQMGWVYDMYFSRTLQIVKEREYLEKLRDALPKSSEKADKIYQAIITFLENRISKP
ncbi:MAG: HD domain-containing protein [Deltaproteobacteria bacterium]|nr:HD domain-containing protein [Deltaproteobacteria bacterium]